MTLNHYTSPPKNRHFLTTFVNVNFSQIFTEWCRCLWHTNSMNSMVIQAFSRHFLWHFSMESYQNARIAITHLFDCINICWVPQKMFEHSAWYLIFKQLPLHPANVNAWKKRVIPSMIIFPLSIFRTINFIKGYSKLSCFDDYLLSESRQTPERLCFLAIFPKCMMACAEAWTPSIEWLFCCWSCGVWLS